MSGYAVSASFYDAVAAEAHAAVDREIADALSGLATADGPVVDVGAGTGLSTQVIADALPEAEILAVEPDPAMRAGLMTRIWADPDLRRRVSILPMALGAAPLPPVVSGVVVSASLVHFHPQERQALWALLAGRLSPTGRAALEIQCPAAVDVADTRVATAQVGRVAYEAWASAERVDHQRQRWRMRYRAQLDGVVIDRQSTDYACWAISAETVLTEARAHGLTGFEAGSLVVLHR